MTREKHKDESRSNKGIIIAGIVVSIVAILSIISFVNPVMIIGVIWDWDIEQQLIKVNNNAMNQELEKITFRLTYDNNDETEIRIERAINVYLNMFEGQNTYIVEKTENNTRIEFTWETYYEKSLLEQRESQLESYYGN